MAGTLVIDTLKASTGVLATQNGMTGIPKAWCNYNGVATTIRGSFNVSSVTRNGVGDYTLNFTTAMPDANYAVAASGNGSTLTNYGRTVDFGYQTAPSTTAVRVTLVDYNGGFNEALYLGVIVCGN